MLKRKFAFHFDLVLLIVSAALLLAYYARFFPSQLGTDFLMAVAIIGTFPVLISAIRSVGRWEVSIDQLASVALVASLLAGEWASAVFINLMLASARVFGYYTDNQARRAIKSLMKLRPEKVKLKTGDKITEIPTAKIKTGDMLIVESGNRIPVDGTIMDGQASIDQSSLTGESVPVSKTKGDSVISSTLNVSGTLTIRADKIGKDTTLSKIIELVEKSQQNKAHINNIAERFTTWYIVATFVGSIAAYAYFGNLNFVLALLLVACADDIAVAIPLGFLAAIGSAAKRGIIIKGGDFIEKLTKVKTLLMDKTGTLTLGKLQVEKVIAFDDFGERALIQYAAALGSLSEHPSAKAVVDYASKNSIDFPRVEKFNEIPGKGTSAYIDNKKIISGKAEFFDDNNIKISEHQANDIKSAENNGLNVTLIGFDGKLVGFIGLADQLRPNIKTSLSEMRTLGVKHFIMLTGDNEKVAQKIANETGIKEYHANLLPESKLDYIKKHVGKDGQTAMVGDGVNDAASLALADIGIAMGVIGSDAAIEAADIALMKDDFSKIPEAIKLGKWTMRIAYQDFTIWGIVNVIGFGLVFGHVIGPEGAAAYNFLTDFLPFANSLRLFRVGKI